MDQSLVQLQSRGWADEVTIVQSLIAELQDPASSLKEVQNKILSCTNEMQGEDFGPIVSGGELMNKYRHGYMIAIVSLLASLIFFITIPAVQRDMKKIVSG